MKALLSSLLALALSIHPAGAADAPTVSADGTVLFDGSSLAGWEFAPGAWEIEEDGSLVCRMESFEADDGTPQTRSMGYIWTRDDYGDFELSLSYKLSEAANSGVFFRSDKGDPVQSGSEVQLLDDEGYQKRHNPLDAKHLNGSFYDASAPKANPAKPAGEWNTLVLKCVGPRVTCHINGVQVFDIDLNDWTEAGKNPDGTPNKFKTAIKDKPLRG
ncbi:MAG TPA: DUF1080 domain-containing protein, partial [Bacteroidia bacterium]|nr:DUF1080 domain-containing protein [Bacteroidia bacterium]